ncbi:type II secretion system F family protein [Alteribacter natronophilus]|uniref:type II secretion system F family protein n=1 Tax=Alteribacter natronophilus TaxID=2583810 RepID=UPI00110E0A3B|nr:type II secretion system F family protein [Alteribacter natronophilus]TMW73782.1 type II secretion system F family protein [Alteribacter natronophilus]
MLLGKRRPFKDDRERGEWLQQTASLVGEGYPLKEALEIVGGYYSGPAGDAIKTMVQALRQGEPFSLSLDDFGYPKEVSNYLLMMERHGDFQEGLKTAAELCLIRHDLKEEARKVLQYPLFMFFGLIILVTFVLRTVIPQFEQFFSQTGAELPFISGFLFSFLRMIDLPLIIVFLLLLAAAGKVVGLTPVKVKIRLLSSLPFVRNYIRLLFTYLFVSQISPVLNNGLSLNECLLLIRKDSLFPVFRHEAGLIHAGLQNGTSFSDLLRSRALFEPQLASVAALGEKRGRTGDELERYSRFLKVRLTYSFSRLFQKLQPLLYGVIGLVMLLMFVSLMMPVFQLTELW